MEVVVKSQSVVECKVILVLQEDEARALEAICGYGPDKFVEWFYSNLGKHYLQPHEKGMRSLFETVRKELPWELRKVDDIRKAAQDILYPKKPKV